MKRLKQVLVVDPRTVWQDEATAFTPWLAESDNIARLGEAVGLELEYQAREQAVGQFRADIVCRDRKARTPVLVENQLARSDHGHLGKLLTYAAGVGAVTIIWVCPAFCREHIAAVKWLNEVTSEHCRFFAVKFELLQISALQGPRFTVLLGPDDRERKQRKKLAVPLITESAKRRREYWQEFLTVLRLSDTEIRIPAPNTLGNLRFNLQGRNLWITVYAASSLGRIGVFLKGNPEYIPKLWSKRKPIESKIAAPVSWNNGENQWSVAVSRKADASERKDWPRQHRWLSHRLTEFITAFKPFVTS